MFRDRRLEHFQKETMNELDIKLNKESIDLERQIENLTKKLNEWNTWWENYGRFLIPRGKYQELLNKYNNLEKQYNLQVQENKVLKEEKEKLEKELNNLKTKLQKEKFETDSKICQFQKPFFTPVQFKWLKLLKHPFRCLIIGKAGSGKSALGHFLLETFHFQRETYILGFPKDKVKYLPNYINVVNSLEKIPPESICLIDEAYLFYYARDSMKENKHLDLVKILGLFRHMETSLIFITQNTSILDKMVLGMTDFVIFKEISKLNIAFERKELKKIIEDVIKKFDSIKGDKKNLNYVISADGNIEEFIENELPSYWSEELSRAYQSGFLYEERFASKISREEKRELARQYKAQGYSYKQIAKMMGVSKSTIINWVKNQE